MSVNLEINKKISIIFVVLISGGLWYYSAFAQDTNANLALEKTELKEKIEQFDSLLNIGVSSPLTALALTGAAFLISASKRDSEEPTNTQLMHEAKKNLIKAFVIFLACTITIFVFDFVELLFIISFLGEIVDIIMTYTLLFVGFAYLVIAAKKMYQTQVK